MKLPRDGGGVANGVEGAKERCHGERIQETHTVCRPPTTLLSTCGASLPTPPDWSTTPQVNPSVVGPSTMRGRLPTPRVNETPLPSPKVVVPSWTSRSAHSPTRHRPQADITSSYQHHDHNHNHPAAATAAAAYAPTSSSPTHLASNNAPHAVRVNPTPPSLHPPTRGARVSDALGSETRPSPPPCPMLSLYLSMCSSPSRLPGWTLCRDHRRRRRAHKRPSTGLRLAR